MTNVIFQVIPEDRSVSSSDENKDSSPEGNSGKLQSSLIQEKEEMKAMKDLFLVIGKASFSCSKPLGELMYELNTSPVTNLKTISRSISSITIRSPNDNRKQVVGSPLKKRRTSTGALETSPIELTNFLNHGQKKQVSAKWPNWLTRTLPSMVLQGFNARSANTFEKISTIKEGIHGHMLCKARDKLTGEIVALKKVWLDSSVPESALSVTNEILILRQLDHPNVIKLKGLVTSRMRYGLYLIFEFMEHDLTSLTASQGTKFTVPQVQSYMRQLLSGLAHCHSHGVLHRDIERSNLLLNSEGLLKIADFRSATFFNPKHQHPLTSHVATLRYRSPEILLGAKCYGVGVDLWSTGCILAELLAGIPIMLGRTEVEQLHRIFKLCGLPSEDYCRKIKLPHFKPQYQYKRCITETFRDFPPSMLTLLEILLSIDPAERQTAKAALRSDFFTNKPCAYASSRFPKYPSSKGGDANLRVEAAESSSSQWQKCW